LGDEAVTKELALFLVRNPLTLEARAPINLRLNFELQAPDFGFLAPVSAETEFFIAVRR
jgi:hypothetical protein